MSLSNADVQRIARLSRIALKDEEVTEIASQLNGIFGLIEQLQAIDTTGVEPMAHARDVALRLRDDIVQDSNQREHFQACAPAVSGGLYLVPQVIES